MSSAKNKKQNKIKEGICFQKKNAFYCCLAFVVPASLARTLFFQLCPTACGVSGKEPTCQCRRHKRQEFNPWVRKIPWRRTWPLTPVFLPGESHGQRAWQAKVHRIAESDTTEATWHSSTTTHTACRISVSLTRDGTRAPCTGSLES